MTEDGKLQFKISANDRVEILVGDYQDYLLTADEIRVTIQAAVAAAFKSAQNELS